MTKRAVRCSYLVDHLPRLALREPESRQRAGLRSDVSDGSLRRPNTAWLLLSDRAVPSEEELQDLELRADSLRREAARRAKTTADFLSFPEY